MKLQGQKIGVLIESDFYEKEIFYYEHRFPEEGLELHFLSRMWNQPSITFKGHEEHYPFECHESFEGMSDEELRSYSAIIVPSGMVSDRLRYVEAATEIPPATQFLARAFAEKSIIKGVICHALWLFAPQTALVRGRKMTCHNNLIGDAKAYGVDYQDEDLVVDGDLVSARTGGHCHLMARQIIEMLSAK